MTKGQPFPSLPWGEERDMIWERQDREDANQDVCIDGDRHRLLATSG